MTDSPKNSERATRRRFIWGALAGGSLLGLGGATGFLAASDAPAKAAKAAKRGRTLGKEFTYDVGPLTVTDPKLIRFNESGRIHTGLKEVTGLALGADQRVYVAGDRAVRVFSGGGERVGDIALGERPRCLAAVAGRDLLYVGLTKHVQIFNGQGVRQAKWESLGEKAVVTAIGVGAKDVFVADAGNRIVRRYDRAGNRLGVIGQRDPSKDVLGFVVPSPYFDLGVGMEGLLWVVNPGRHRLEAYTFEGELQTAWGEAANAIHGFCGCCNPVHFTRLADGRFVTSEKGLPRVKVYSEKGVFECVVAGPELFRQQLESPPARVCMALAVDAGGRILVADSVTRDVRIFAAKPTSEPGSIHG